MLYLLISFFNQPSYSSICFNSLSTIKIPFTPILVNNGSRLKTSTLLSSWVSEHENAKLVTLPVNKGFAAGINAGVKAIEDLKDDDLVLILHNDSVLFENCVQEMVDCFNEVDDDVAVICPKTSYDYSHSFCIPALRKQFEAIKPSNKERLMPEEIVKIIDTVIPDRGVFLEELKKSSQFRMSYVPEIASFCMLIKGLFLKKYGLFDEEFWPRYWEDRWWWLPIERDGFIVMIANNAFAFHWGSATADSTGYDSPAMFGMNEERYKKKLLERDMRMAETLREKNQTDKT